MIEIITHRHGRLFGCQSSYDCFKNAAHNACLAIESGVGRHTGIIDVNTTAGRHAYLKLHHRVYSHTVTWPTTYYPELSLTDIHCMGGEDVTRQLLLQALGFDEDIYSYHRVIDRLSVRIPTIKYTVIQYLNLNEFS
jgi:hypothetical protein